ncbi:CBS domain-containing protein [Acidiferrimicrobium sp. IK]|uniref:magnesium transporter MgtE N-terminal domain-containing protein n=1 Tax=Acidiferrimicrobium sp. IK TaxID=2871700 RepID=UPI0021CB37BB|nr:CBS domain-containing protein [Acidiferrimicrobium sp. IK]MCU4185674.1 CBS domain-containing protein [Acidiferrimicrobium sp. IK]
MPLRPSLPPVHPTRSLQTRRRHRRQRLLAVRNVRESLVSLAGILSGPVLNPAGGEVGRLADVVARWGGEESYPPVTGLVVRVGRRVVFASIDQVASVQNGRVELASARVDLLDFVRRDGEVMLARDVLDHQLVDIDGVQVIRAADLYLAYVPGPAGRALRLVGADVSAQTLLRRLGPRRWRGTPTPERVIDWSAIAPFGSEVSTIALRTRSDGLRRLRPGELADLLEDLGRDGRQELLASLEPEQAADALEEMDPEELGALLRETAPEDAAELLAHMEPDEAVDALRDLDESEREELLEHMPDEQREELSELLDYEEDEAGGFMTTNLVTATRDENVGALRDRLRDQAEHAGDLDGVVVVDSDGRLVADVTLFALLTADEDATMGSLVQHAEPVSVRTGSGFAAVADRLIATRHSSVVVVDDDERPIGRILADDLIDRLVPERGRHHFPRLLS